MQAFPLIQKYYQEKQRLIEYGGSDNELNIRPAFQNCLAAYCDDHREKLVLIPELRYQPNRTVPDGTVRDALRLARGYWEAKDTHDDLDQEIQNKRNRGYPTDNIIYEDSQTAVLMRHDTVAMRVDMREPADLHRLILAFLDYVLPEVEEFRRAWEQFKNDLPTVLQTLREAIDGASETSSDYRAASADFLKQCHLTIGPDVSEIDVREMLLQHILTKDIFLRVFAEDQFHRENNIARHLNSLEQTFFTGDLRRNTVDDLHTYYAAIGRAADDIADYAEKQHFLKAIYEDFYKVYNPAAADRLGVVYTPNEVVDFIIRGADHLLQKHFGRRLADDNVQILDPATGTGTFITSLIAYLPEDRLRHKYLNEIHANEVAILPYYIANMNIEYTYKERMGRYLEFPNLCFVDTLDNLGWQGASEGTVRRQPEFNLGALSEENWVRVQEQNEKPISVIIGNPPYNDSQTNWNEFNPNRQYPVIDKRIRETYVFASTAQKTHQYDMYKRFIRWASDRLDDDGIVCFITNRAYLEARQDDGFRGVTAGEFTDVYIMDLGSDVRRNPKISGTTHNVFGIQTGVAVGFFVRDKSKLAQCNIHYVRRRDAELASDKLAYLSEATLDGIAFEDITPDKRNGWLNQSDTNFNSLIPVADKQTKYAKNPADERAVFGLVTNAVKSNRDDWVYDFDIPSLRSKALFFADAYNSSLDSTAQSFDPIIKWSEGMRGHFDRGRRIEYDESCLSHALYRPFVTKYYFAETVMNDRLTSNHYQIFGSDLKQTNRALNFCTNGKAFYVLATGSVCDFHFTGDTQCLPLYRYTANGERVSNITGWGLQQFRRHYGDNAISAEDIFAYTYAVLHDPAYLEKYAIDLLREFPRLPFYDDFPAWVGMGQELLDLHIGFESAEPFGLAREDLAGPAKRVMLRADKELGVIRLDDKTRLTGVPADAWRYRLGSRSAIEWVLDQYKERKPRDPTIAAKFDTYRFADHKERVIDLLQQVCTVSVRTMAVVDSMAAKDGQGQPV